MPARLRNVFIALLAVSGLLFMAAGAASAREVPAGNARPDATTACDPECTNIFDEQEGNQYILAAQSAKYNAPILIRHASNSAKSQDFIVTEVGTLGDFCSIDGGTGFIPANSYVCINYGVPDPSYPVFQIQFAPGSFTSGYCVGVAGKAKNGEAVTDRDCGAAPHTLWVGDIFNAVGDSNSLLGFDVPLVNASDSSLSNPLVLTYEGVNKQLKVTEEAANGGVVDDSQQWGATDVK